MAFWREFFSSSNEKVNSPTVIASLLAVPIMLLAMAILIYHSFILGKGLDSNVVNLILGLLGGGGIGYGIGRTAAQYSQGSPSGWRPPPAKPPDGKLGNLYKKEG